MLLGWAQESSARSWLLTSRNFDAFDIGVVWSRFLHARGRKGLRCTAGEGRGFSCWHYAEIRSSDDKASLVGPWPNGALGDYVDCSL